MSHGRQPQPTPRSISSGFLSLFPVTHFNTHFAMEKEESLKPPVPIEDDQLDSQELPPSYDEAVQSNSNQFSGFFRRYTGRSSVANDSRVKVSAWKQDKPLQYYLPDPKHVKCRCGKHVDTTNRSRHLPEGETRCTCGYIVSSTGQSHHESHVKDVDSGISDTCGCGEQLRDFMDYHLWYTCKCGAIFYPDGSVRRICPYHQTSSDDARNVQCKCGKHVDTTAIWKVQHGTKSLTEGHMSGFPWAGYSTYEYTLPAGSGRCECGLIVKRDGTTVSEGHLGCCKVASCKALEAAVGSEESCTCAWR